ncbi:spore coat protein [Bacillus thermotolerans]|uniref:Spore coat protein F n=1 Tax=Bacillus thermotolerans TaxID=1221996 RepID=A0A0F5HLQ5_BACTR|nr:spore coat protein [Bacillus thermotolerans]KKB34188.1 Spore coat protein F [Bacillus thermotolerans]KKB37311.1 Spore coat protein F [Bacillus thermotolerans]KKB39073.1 Spore coat protein F [Bacillus thermotolerans]
MNQLLKNLAGMGGMTDQVIATDFLISAKAGVRNIAVALTETATPELRAVLREQLRSAVETHKNISNYMMAKGYYHPGELDEQLRVDFEAAQTALNLAKD